MRVHNKILIFGEHQTMTLLSARQYYKLKNKTSRKGIIEGSIKKTTSDWRQIIANFVKHSINCHLFVAEMSYDIS